jgi:hypothetical protein
LLVLARFADRNQAVGLAAHRIGADEQPPIYQPERIEPLLSIIPSLVADLSEPVHQHLSAKGERDTMLELIDLVLSLSNSKSMHDHTA